MQSHLHVRGKNRHQKGDETPSGKRSPFGDEDRQSPGDFRNATDNDQLPVPGQIWWHHPEVRPRIQKMVQTGQDKEYRQDSHCDSARLSGYHAIYWELD